MAVLQPSSFDGIYRMLEERARAEREAPPTTGALLARTAGQAAGAYAGAKIGNKIDADQQKELGTFKLNLEKELERYKDEDLEGAEEFTQDDVDNYFKQAGIEDPQFIPKLPKGKLKATPEKIQELMQFATARTEVEKLASQYDKDDPARAAAIRALGASDPKEAAKQELEGSSPFGKLDVVPDAESSTGYSYIQRDKTGNIKKTGLAAPKPSEGSRGSMLDPRRRTDELSKQYERDVKGINFLKYEDAYGAAKRSEKAKPTSASDTRLLYAYAKMLQPTGVLTDQDFRTTVNNGSFGEEAIRMVNKPGEGNVLSASFRKKIAAEIISQYGKASEQLAGIEDQYTRRAEEEKLNAKDVVRDVRTVERMEKEDKEAEDLLRKANKKVTPEAIEIAKKVLKKRNERGKK
jgi:hypothetical protein